ncbi:hypothetical protein F5876DRAFT_50455, partial [Lentinula aff. lateritia]
LIFPPLYSPDFNPIEEAFSAIKSALRRRENQFRGSNSIPWMVREVIKDISTNDAAGWFSDCGYL